MYPLPKTKLEYTAWALSESVSEEGFIIDYVTDHINSSNHGTISSRVKRAMRQLHKWIEHTIEKFPEIVKIEKDNDADQIYSMYINGVFLIRVTTEEYQAVVSDEDKALQVVYNVLTKN